MEFEKIMNGDRHRPANIVARGAINRSDSRKRGRRSESPESIVNTTKDKLHTPKRKKKTEENKSQKKMTEFSESQNKNTVCRKIDTSTKTDMAESKTNTVSEDQFQLLMAEMQKMNTNFDAKFDQCFSKMNERIEKVEGKIF